MTACLFRQLTHSFVTPDHHWPRAWRRRYAYVRNNPVSRIDPTGMVDINPGMMYAMMSGGGGMDCNMDGVSTPCGMVYSAIQGGGAAQCPNNNCGIGTATPYQCLDVVCGYFSNDYVATHENTCGGILCTDSEHTQWVTGNNLAAVNGQREALAQTIAANSGMSYAAALQSLSASCMYVQGGNCNFDALNGLGPDSVDCGGDPRCNGIHFPGIDPDTGNYYVHLDTSNPFYGDVFSFLEHGFVDVFLGNFFYYVIPRQ